MDDYTIKAGDIGSRIEATLLADGAAVDLTGSSVRFLMASAQYGTGKVDSVATVTDPLAGTVSYAWSASDVDTSGAYLGEFEVTFPDSSVATFPNAGFIAIRVIEDLN